MKKVGLLLGASVVSFAIGLLGLYGSMPYLAPDHVQHSIGDTLSDAVVDSLIRTRMQEAHEDSIQAVEEAALEIVGLTPDSLDNLRFQATRVRALRDSLQLLRETIDREEQHHDSLQTALAEVKARAAKLENSEQTAEEISKAFTQIENREMSQILEHVHPTVLRKLYTQASARDRARILRALSPDQAARFLEGLVDPSLAADNRDSTATGTTLAGDSTALEPTDSQLQ